MILGWLRRRRRRKLLSQPLPDHWRPWLAAIPLYGSLDESERTRLHDLMRILIAEKNWEGCSGLQLTEEMQVVIAAQASVLLLGLPTDEYRDVTSILVHPTSFEYPFEWRDGLGIVTEHRRLLGEAWYRGPVLLAWDATQHGARDPRDGTNLVLHEFAHRLDFASLRVDGTPPLEGRVSRDDWRRVMTGAFEQLREASRRGRRTLLDPYGTENEAEFFAVAVEAFFERAEEMQEQAPELYDVLARFFGQDPAARDRAAKVPPAPSE